jgi:hypothetical protein
LHVPENPSRRSKLFSRGLETLTWNYGRTRNSQRIGELQFENILLFGFRIAFVSEKKRSGKG